MSRGILVSFAGYPVMASSFYPDNGLASLAGALRAAGHEALVLDYNRVSTLEALAPPELTAELSALLPELLSGPGPDTIAALLAVNARLDERLRVVADLIAGDIEGHVARQRSDFVGFKLWSGDGFVASVRIAERLRAGFPGLKIFGGGPAVLYSEETIYHHSTVFDALVDGEGEQAIVALAAYSSGAGELVDAPNLITWRDGAPHRTPRSFVPDLDQLAPPDYSLEVYPSLAGDEHIRLFIVDESRGCPMGCAFCLHHGATGDRWRTRSCASVLHLLEEIHARFATRAFRLGGSFTPPKLMDQLTAELRTSQRWQFTGYTHPAAVARADLAPWRDAGCVALFLGIESFADDDLRRLGKKLDGATARCAVTACIDASIVPVISLIVPLPGQTSDALRETRIAALDLLEGKRACAVTQFPALLPRTPWWYERPASGFVVSVTDDQYRARAATYKIRHILPPALWDATPYTVDGLTFSEFTRRATDFQHDLAAAGVPVNLSDDSVLLASLLNISAHDMRDSMLQMLFALDAYELASFVKRANEALTFP